MKDMSDVLGMVGEAELGALLGLWCDQVQAENASRIMTKGVEKAIAKAVECGELPRPFRLMGKNVWMVSALRSYFEERQPWDREIDFPRFNRTW